MPLRTHLAPKNPLDNVCLRRLMPVSAFQCILLSGQLAHNSQSSNRRHNYNHRRVFHRLHSKHPLKMECLELSFRTIQSFRSNLPVLLNFMGNSVHTHCLTLQALQPVYLKARRNLQSKAFLLLCQRSFLSPSQL